MSYYAPSEIEILRRQAGLAEFDAWNERILLATFALFGIPRSYLDLGCGTGAMTALARRLGVDAIGIDVIAQPPDIRHDLTEPIHLGRSFSLITCIETAEHLPEQAAATLADTITRHLDSYLIWTAAMPGQPGDHHVNLQSQKWWEALFYASGLEVDLLATYALIHLWRICGGPLSHHLPANLTVYRRRQ